MKPSESATRDPAGGAFISTARGSFVRLMLHPPGQPETPVGVLLLETEPNRLHLKFRDPWPASLPREDREVLRAFAAELEARAASEPGDALLAELEDAFSHILRLSARESVLLRNPQRDLERLYARHVAEAVAAKKAEDTAPHRGAPARQETVSFRTHLPFYPIQVAAGLFDGDVEVEPDGWLPLPEGLRPDERCFVGCIHGKSMEPRIPDGSYCVFRLNPQGSREGKLVLVQQYGTSESGGAFVIKKYHSEKQPQRPASDRFGDAEFAETEDLGGAEWRHARVRLISLNPLYPSWDLKEGECRILAELVRILGEHEIPEDWR